MKNLSHGVYKIFYSTGKSYKILKQAFEKGAKTFICLHNDCDCSSFWINRMNFPYVGTASTSQIQVYSLLMALEGFKKIFIHGPEPAIHLFMVMGFSQIFQCNAFDAYAWTKDAFNERVPYRRVQEVQNFLGFKNRLNVKSVKYEKANLVLEGDSEDYYILYETADIGRLCNTVKTKKCKNVPNLIIKYVPREVGWFWNVMDEGRRYDGAWIEPQKLSLEGET